MKTKTSPSNITKLALNEIFVYGSNLAGVHGKGASLIAKKKFGAIQGKYGRIGQSYGIPIKDGRDRNFKKSLSLDEIGKHVHRFMTYARAHPEFRFLVTEVGCGLGGFVPKQIAPLFYGPIPDNIALPKSFWAVLTHKQ